MLAAPASPASPGSLLGVVLPLESATLLVEAPGPLALLAGVPAGVAVPPPARREGDVVVLAGPGRDLGSGLAGSLRALAATTSPTAWTGTVDGSRVLVTLDGDRLQVRADGVPASRVRAALEGSLPSSPGRSWRQLLADAEVTGAGDGSVLTARTTAALPPTLLRQLVDRGSLPPR